MAMPKRRANRVIGGTTNTGGNRASTTARGREGGRGEREGRRGGKEEGGREGGREEVGGERRREEVRREGERTREIGGERNKSIIITFVRHTSRNVQFVLFSQLIPLKFSGQAHT